MYQLAGLLLAVFVCVFGGNYCSDVNQLELTVLSSGVRLYISHCVVLHNDPQWRTLPKEHGCKMGEGCSSLGRYTLLFLPFSTFEGILGSFNLSEEVTEISRKILQELKRDGVCSQVLKRFYRRLNRELSSLPLQSAGSFPVTFQTATNKGNVMYVTLFLPFYNDLMYKLLKNNNMTQTTEQGLVYTDHFIWCIYKQAHAGGGQ